MDNVIRSDVLFHYGLHPDFDPGPVVRNGLWPLSRIQPDLTPERRAVFRALDAVFAEPVLGPDPDRHTGIYLTPIDFQALASADRPTLAWIRGFGRFRIPREVLDPAHAVMTWAGPFPRTVRALSDDALADARHRWTPERVVVWFGTDRTKMFWHVPQVVAYQPVVPVSWDQWEPPP